MTNTLKKIDDTLKQISLYFEYMCQKCRQEWASKSFDKSPNNLIQIILYILQNKSCLNNNLNDINIVSDSYFLYFYYTTVDIFDQSKMVHITRIFQKSKMI